MESEDDALAQLREFRSKENINLKPSPYLRSNFTNEYGEEHELVIRNYQKQMVMNLLFMEKFLNGEDTGLGKTLEVLTTIGYVWMQEPEYVPVIVTTKSALFQWAAEVNKFLQGMEAVVVSGEPIERHRAYEEFFLNHDPSKKRVLLLTYDMIMYDMEESVIREKAAELRKGFGKDFAKAKELKKLSLTSFEAHKSAVQDLVQTAPEDVREYVGLLTHYWYEGMTGVAPVKPQTYAELDSESVNQIERAIRELIDAKSTSKHWEDEVARLTAEKFPPKKVPGIYEYALECKSLHPCVKFMLVMDEMHKLKNHKSQFHEKTAKLSGISSRRIGMTATPVKNKLMEFFSLFRILEPTLFPKVTKFQNDFCVTKLQRVKGGRQVPIIVGYKNLDQFVKITEPYYLSRKKHEVAKELPTLLSREVECELSVEQEELYEMAEDGTLNPSEPGEDGEDDSADVLKALTLCQQAANAPQLVLDEEGNPFEGKSSKIDTLVDFLSSEAEGQKVIVFSRYEQMISLVEKRLNKEGIKNVRITGKENDPKLRQRNRETFQNKSSGVDVIMITTAGAESLNLQSAEHFIFLDLPWSWGDYVQLIGRMVRIGSQYITVMAHHFLSRKTNGGKTIDHHVLQALRTKKVLADKVAGENLQDGLQFSREDMLLDILRLIKTGNASPTDLKEKAKSVREAVKTTKKAPKKSVKSEEPAVKTCALDFDISDL
jgi:SNF2 family DNA or RNA helicase